MDRDIYAEAGHVSCEEAREILSRFIASHFDGRMGASTGEHARFSIPANPRRDDDLRLEAFIQRVEKMERELDAVRAERDEARARLAEVQGESAGPWKFPRCGSTRAPLTETMEGFRDRKCCLDCDQWAPRHFEVIR